MKQSTKFGIKNAKREEVAPRDSKTPTKQQRETALRLAVRHKDSEAFEDYDESGT